MEKVKKQELESLFVGYDQALALKELGFEEFCFACVDEDGVYLKGDIRFNSTIQSYAPLYQQAFRWFREKHEIFTYIHLYRTDMAGNPLEFEYYYRFPKKRKSKTVREYKTYEEAEQACLDKLIEICKNK